MGEGNLDRCMYLQKNFRKVLLLTGRGQRWEIRRFVWSRNVGGKDFLIEINSAYLYTDVCVLAKNKAYMS